METEEIPIDRSVGLTLAYDLTGITPGEAKGAVLRRGHVITDGDLEVLREIGKSYIKILRLAPDEIHEDDAALELARTLAGPGIEVVMPGEAWADLVASNKGLLKVDADRLLRLNLLEDILVATRHNNSPAEAGETLARVKVRDLIVGRTVLDEAKAVAAADTRALEILPYRSMAAGAVITGREIYEGRRKDAFAPLLRRRLEECGSTLEHAEIVPDERAVIRRAIEAALEAGRDLVLVTGGGSPDDATSEAITESADEVVFHGVPVAPGAMTILAYAGEVPILGVPAGLLARTRGFLDLVLPRLLAGERLDSEDAARYGHGGLCLRCGTCTFPVCPFGR